MGKDERINYIADLYSQISKGEEVVDRLTKINNATIESICAFEGPAYFRVKGWLESKVGKKIQEERKGELETEEDIKKFKEVLSNCYELMKGRMEKYGNSWRIMDIQSLALLIMMKMDRIAELGPENAKTFDEIQDSINYCAFMAIKFKEKNNL